MDLKFAITADQAMRSDVYRLTVIDTFKSVLFMELPGSLARGVLVMEWEAHPQEAGSEPLVEISLTDPDGNEILRFPTSSFEVPLEPAIVGVPNFFNSIIDLQGLTFERPGRHELRIFANREEKGSASLYVYGPPQE